MDRIYYNKDEFIIDRTIRDELHLVRWDSIDTIIFGSDVIYDDHSEYIIYLNTPSIVTLKEKPWWLNKITFFLRSKSNTKIRIRDDFNQDFYQFVENIASYLGKEKVINVLYDNRKGKIVKTETHVYENKTVFIERGVAEKSSQLRWKMVYDRFGRSVDEIYERDRGI